MRVCCTIEIAGYIHGSPMTRVYVYQLGTILCNSILILTLKRKFNEQITFIVVGCCLLEFNVSLSQ